MPYIRSGLVSFESAFKQAKNYSVIATNIMEAPLPPPKEVLSYTESEVQTNEMRQKTVTTEDKRTSTSTLGKPPSAKIPNSSTSLAAMTSQEKATKYEGETLRGFRHGFGRYYF